MEIIILFKNDKITKNIVVQTIVLIAYTVYFGVLRIFIIPFGDDQFWWGPAGKYLMQHHVFTLKDQAYIGGSSNGRYLSNLVFIYCMHHPLFSYILFGVFSTLVVWLIYHLVGGKTTIFLLALILPFTLSKPFVATTWFWYVAFIHYVTGVVFILGYLCILKRDILDHRDSSNVRYIFYSLLLSLLGGTMVEHVTVYQVVIGVSAILLTWYLHHNLKGYQIAYLFGAVTSAIVMFSNGTYWHHTEYRSVPFSMIASEHVYTQSSHYWLITLNLFVIILLTAAVFITIIQKNRRTIFDFIIQGGSVLFALYYLFMNIYLDKFFNLDSFLPIVSHKISVIDSWVSILFIFYLFLTIISVTDNNKLRSELLFCLLSFGLLIAPFLVITQPNSAREFFNGVVFLYIFAFILIKHLRFSNFWSKFLNVCLIIFLLSGATITMSRNVIDHQSFMPTTKNLEAPGAIAPEERVPYPNYFPNGDLYTTPDSIGYWKEFNSKSFKQRLWTFDYNNKN
jgi:hypothetical protein